MSWHKSLQIRGCLMVSAIIQQRNHPLRAMDGVHVVAFAKGLAAFHD
jgi:hypothetical protein